MLAVGSIAPDFTLENHHRQPVRLSAFLGQKNVVLAFHPLAFTPVCATQVQTYEREKARFESLDTRVMAISVDPGPSKKAWSDSLGGISHDLLSDFHPHGKVAHDYGVLRADGIAERAVFIVDKSGKIAWAKRYDIPEQPPIDDLFVVLQEL
jgi:peroxiredoxin (alkyl hydroperoxide reductase subunit C)